MKTVATTPVAERDTPGWPDFAGLLEDQSQWAAQAFALQAAWVASCWALQGEWLSKAWDPAGAWPPWMVWHNGTEQLA